MFIYDNKNVYLIPVPCGIQRESENFLSPFFMQPEKTPEIQASKLEDRFKYLNQEFKKKI